MSFHWVENEATLLAKEEFTDTYGSIIEDIRATDNSVFYYPLFLYRRLIYAALVIFLLDYSMIQLIAIIVVSLLPVLLILNVDVWISFVCEAF